ncbi:hypothetical protein DFH08DRAFT_872766 [Mycena albidolilacea]|uniref:Uncharacterized protein n=1 Tax=Mycena albidolilacea TaxID=1033008 RepID=A0AAD6ZXC3_9AGAR|nr:hypothetical protein DFH08DRAFT_872766 [Mycena albidolilacea]
MFKLPARTSLRLAVSSGRSASIRARNVSQEAVVGVVPGVPPASQATRTPRMEMSFSMPDVSIQPSQPQPQIPYSPDFWESAARKSEETRVPEEPLLPKLSVISELDTVTSHNLHVENVLPDTQSLGPSSVDPSPVGKGGILDDISEDLGISPKAIKDGVSSFLRSFR